MAIAYLNDTVRLTVTFRTFSGPNDNGELADPDTVVFNVLTTDSTPSVIFTDTPTKLDFAIYQYDWIPMNKGEVVVQFVGTFSDASTDIIQEEFIVLEVGEDPPQEETLGTDYVLTFAGVITPMCMDPDELTGHFPEATYLEIAEAIRNATLDLQFLLKLKPDECSADPLAYEYIKAAAACALTKVYGGVELDGSGTPANSIRLGDLQVDKGSNSGFSTNRGTITPETATTWCELAGALRKEILVRGVGMKAVVRGAAYDNPIPRRHFQPNPGNWPRRHPQGDLDDVQNTRNWN